MSGSPLRSQPSHRVLAERRAQPNHKEIPSWQPQRYQRWIGVFSLLCGSLGLFGFFIAPSLGMATGLAERLAGYPVVVWMVVLGVFLLRCATRAHRPSATPTS